MLTPENRQPNYFIGILEDWGPNDLGSKWCEITVSGKKIWVKNGDVTYYVWMLPKEALPWAFDPFPPGWPIGAKIRLLDDRVNALWVPGLNIWLKSKF